MAQFLDRALQAGRVARTSAACCPVSAASAETSPVRAVISLAAPAVSATLRAISAVARPAVPPRKRS